MDEFNKELINETAEVVAKDVVPAVSKNGVIGLAVGLGVAAVAGVATWARKKGKIDEMNIRHLEKKGYIVSKVEQDEEEPKKDSKK